MVNNLTDLLLYVNMLMLFTGKDIFLNKGENLMLPSYFAYIAAAISTLSGLSYVISTLKGKTQPNRVTWLLLTFFTTIVFFAALDSDVSTEVLIAIASPYFNVAAVFLASFVNPKAYWKTTKQDYFYGGLALVGFVLWQLTDSPELAVAFSIVADALAATPTAIKACKKPKSEKGSSFGFWTLSSLITVGVVQNWNFTEYAFPVYLVFFNAMLAYLTMLRPRLLKK